MGKSAKFLKKKPKPAASSGSRNHGPNPLKQSTSASAVVSVPTAKRRERIIKPTTKNVGQSREGPSGTKPVTAGRILGGADYVDLIYGSRKKAQEEAQRVANL
ncbi:hypothetical protein FRB90_007977 [Tulasnella sp. 427]|nr:hypothetical protein FRB90_007977 [Tulasnella sp. 427]